MELKIGKNKFKVKEVRGQKETQQGMMGKKFNDSFNGMLFHMDDHEHCFWMKNCIISLDIVFISDDEITKIHHSCPPCNSDDCRNYCGYGDKVLELPSDTCRKKGISVGDKVFY